MIERVAKLSGVDHPLIVLPPELRERRRRCCSGSRADRRSLEGIRLMAPDWRYSSAKARRELGYDAARRDRDARSARSTGISS